MVTLTIISVFLCCIWIGSFCFRTWNKWSKYSVCLHKLIRIFFACKKEFKCVNYYIILNNLGSTVLLSLFPLKQSISWRWVNDALSRIIGKSLPTQSFCSNTYKDFGKKFLCKSVLVLWWVLCLQKILSIFFFKKKSERILLSCPTDASELTIRLTYI